MASLIWSPLEINGVVLLETAVVEAGECTYTFVPGVAQNVPVEHVAQVTEILTGGPSALPSPASPAVASVGAGGSTTYAYDVVWVTEPGDSSLSADGITSSGNAVLSSVNYNQISRPSSPVPSAIGWRVVRQSGGSLPAVRDISNALPLGTAAFNDTGIAGHAYAPPDIISPYGTVASGPSDL